MASLTKLVSCALLIVSWSTIACGRRTESGRHAVLVTFSGLNSDDLSQSNSPSLFALTEKGVSVTVKSVFPAESYPNRYSLATGLAPSEHGILFNKMPDEGSKSVLDMEQQTGDVLLKGEPIWTTSQREHIQTAVWTTGKRTTGGKLLASPCGECKSESIVSKLVSWLHGKIQGNSSASTLSVVTFPAGPVSEHDGIAKKLLDEIERSGLSQLVNIIFTGEYGLVSSGQKRTPVCLPEVEHGVQYNVVDYSGGIVSLEPEGNGSVFELLEHFKGESSVQAFEKIDFSRRYDLTPTIRIAPVVAVVQKKDHVIVPGNCEHVVTQTKEGRSGYMTESTSFVAVGPRFVRGLSSSTPIHVTDIHKVLCTVLNIHNGYCNRTLSAALQKFFTEEPTLEPEHNASDDSSFNFSHRHVTGVGVFLIILSGFGFLAVIYWMKKCLSERQRQASGYRLMKNGFEPDLSLRSEPLLGADSTDYYPGDSVQLSVMGESSIAHALGSDDESPPGTFSI